MTRTNSPNGSCPATTRLGAGPKISAARAKARIGLERIDQLEEIVAAHDALELKAGAVLIGPDHVRLDSPDDGQADDNAFTASQLFSAGGHEAVRGNIDDVQVHVAKPAMFTDYLVIHRMAHRPAKIGYGKLCSCTHDCLQF